MEESGFIVGLDIGTSNIIGLLGRKNEQGVISILASESVPAESSVRHGIIYNIDEASGKIRKLLSLLENKVGKKIGKVYVSLAGMSLRAIEHIETETFALKAPVGYTVYEQMERRAKMVNSGLLTNYSVVAPEIYLDSVLENDYIDKSATKVEARYRIIVGRPNMKSNLIRCITTKNQIEIAGFIVGPIATATILLDDEDKNAGCALIDFGGGTTTVSIYKNGFLRFMSVIPFGGRTITKDIQALGFADEAAESYKIRYGRIGKNKLKSASGQEDKPAVDVKEINRVIQLRQDEIILNVINQIKESGYEGQLDAGIVITGGASQLNGLSDYLSEKTKMKVKTGTIKRLYINNAIDLLQNPSYSQCLGLMLFAKENCEKAERPRPEIRRPVTQENPVEEKDVEEREENGENEIEEDKTPPKNPGKQQKQTKKGMGIIDFFGKIQNLGGTMFKDED